MTIEIEIKEMVKMIKLDLIITGMDITEIVTIKIDNMVTINIIMIIEMVNKWVKIENITITIIITIIKVWIIIIKNSLI